MPKKKVGQRLADGSMIDLGYTLNDDEISQIKEIPNKVPKTRKINNKELSEDITLTPEDIGVTQSIIDLEKSTINASDLEDGVYRIPAGSIYKWKGTSGVCRVLYDSILTISTNTNDSTRNSILLHGNEILVGNSSNSGSSMTKFMTTNDRITTIYPDMAIILSNGTMREDWLHRTFYAWGKELWFKQTNSQNDYRIPTNQYDLLYIGDINENGELYFTLFQQDGVVMGYGADRNDVPTPKKILYKDIATLSDIPTDYLSFNGQSLTDEQKAQARINIGAGTSNFSGRYSDLIGVPADHITKDVNNLTNYTLSVDEASKISLVMDNSTYVLTVKLLNSKDEELSSSAVDFPLESMVVNATYDSTNKQIILTLKNGTTTSFSVVDLISGLATQSALNTTNENLSNLEDKVDEIEENIPKEKLNLSINNKKFISNYSWSEISWEGVSSPFPNCIWTDGENIYYTSSSSLWVLDEEARKWTYVKELDLYMSDNSRNIWSDGENLYFSSPSKHKVWDKSSLTWVDKTWNGLTSFYGDSIWSDGENIYHSNANSSNGTIGQYVLDIETSTWVEKQWNGANNFSASRVWNDGENIYLSDEGTQAILKGDTWEPVEWKNLTNYDGVYIWTDGDGIYYSYGNEQYELDIPTRTWKAITWNGATSFYGHDGCIWSTLKNIYCYSNSKHYILNKSTKTRFLGKNQKLFPRINLSNYATLSELNGKVDKIQGTNYKDYLMVVDSGGGVVPKYYSDTQLYKTLDALMDSFQAMTFMLHGNLFSQYGESITIPANSYQVVDITQDVFKVKTLLDNGSSIAFSVFDCPSGIKPTLLWKADWLEEEYDYDIITKMSGKRGTFGSGGTINNFGVEYAKIKITNTTSSDITFNMQFHIYLRSMSTLNNYYLYNNGNDYLLRINELRKILEEYAKTSELPSPPDLSSLVPNTRTINGKALSSNISLGSKDVGALPDYTLTISHQSAGNPRMVKFASVNYSSKATCFKMAAMTCHDNGVSYQFLTDMLIAVTAAGQVTANIYKFAQSSVGSVDGIERYTGDVFYVNDTTNKIVDFYILCGQWSASQFTPVTKVGSTTIDYVTQYSGSATYYSSGTKEWASGCGTTYARLSDLSGYVPLAGGSLTGRITVNASNPSVFTRSGSDTPILVDSTATSTYIQFAAGGATKGYIGVNASNKPVFYDSKDHQLAFTENISKLGTSNWKVTQDSSGNLVFTYE